MNNRALLGVAVAALVLTSGCLTLITGGTPTYEASPTVVSDAALEETGYVLADRESRNVSQNFSVAGQERSVRVVNEIARYERTVSLGPLGEAELARFLVLSTPAVEIAGQTFNPVGDWSERRIVREVSSQYEGLSNVSHVSNRTVRVAGEDRSVAKFSGRATVVAGTTIDVQLHVATFRAGDDFVVAVGVHPAKLPDEQGRVDTLLRGVER